MFDFSPALYEPVSLLAPRSLVFNVLTRTFQDRDEEVQQVAPNYHAAAIPKKLRLIEALGKEQTNGADAAQ